MKKLTKDVAVNYVKIILQAIEENNLLTADNNINYLQQIIHEEMVKKYWTHIETVAFEEKEVIASFIKTLKAKGAVEVKPLGKIIDGMTNTYQITMYDLENEELKDFIYKDLQGKQVVWMSEDYKELYK